VGKAIGAETSRRHVHGGRRFEEENGRKNKGMIECEEIEGIAKIVETPSFRPMTTSRPK
jgi:hypothetical protein